MTRLQSLSLSLFVMAGCTSDKPVEVKQKEEAFHRGLSEAAKKADPVRNLKEASDAIRTFKISDAVDAGLKKQQAKSQELRQATRNTLEKSENQPKQSQPNHSERRSP